MLSNRNLVQWYAESTARDLTETTLWTAPLWIYKSLMFLWALWVAASFFQWLRFGWAIYRDDDRCFRPKPRGGPRQTHSTPDAREVTTPDASPDRERAGVS